MNKKILFVQPFALDFYNDQKKLGNLTLIWPIYLENYLKSKIENICSELLYLPLETKINISTFEERDKFYEQMDDLISNVKFDIDENTYICLSGTTSYYYLSIKLIAEYFHERYPSAIVIFGGVHASTRPHDFDSINSPIDYVVIGEGEVALCEIIKSDFKKQKSPRIIVGKPIQYLDELPPLDLSLLGKYIKSFNSLNISLSRGCPFKCTFCLERNVAKNMETQSLWRAYSPKRAISETKTMIDFGTNFGIKEYGFVDPTFGVKKEWFNKFLEIWNFEERSSATWIETRVDLLNDKTIETLKKKRFFLWYGVESCSKEMLKIMNKHINPKVFLSKLETTFKKHIELNYLCMSNVIFNHPGETKETCLESFEGLKKILNFDKNNSLYFSLRYYHNFPGTIIYNNYPYFNTKYGTEFYFPEWWKSEDLLKYGPYSVKASRSLDLSQVVELYTSFYKELYNINIENLKENKPDNYKMLILGVLKQIKSFEDLKQELLDFIKERKLEK